MIPTIETERLALRGWRKEYLGPYAAMNADPEVRRYMHPARPLSADEAAADIATIEDQWARLGFGHWAVTVRETGELIGRAGAKRHADWPLDPENSEVGWLFARSAWGHGYATEAAAAAVGFLLELGRPEIISIAAPENHASHRVMERVGLTRAGALRWEARQLDVVWYSLQGLCRESLVRRQFPAPGRA